MQSAKEIAMKFKHILFAVDFSAPSRALKKEVEWLANRFQATVSLLHVVEIPPIWYAGFDCGTDVTASMHDLVDASEERLAQFSLAVPDARLRRIVKHGDPAVEIDRYARDHKVDLIVIGTHGYGPLRSMLCGSVLGKVLHDTNCAVWTAAFTDGGCRCRPVVSKILCAVELTSEAVPLLTYAKDLASSFSAQVRVVHAVAGAETRPNKYFDFDLHRFLTDSARVDLGKMQRAAGTDFPVTVGSGSIARAIGDSAAEYGADLVLMGRGHSQTALGYVRTQACDIIRQVPCPVLSCVITQDRIFSSCIGVHPGQFAAAEPLQTDYLTTSLAHPQ